MTSWGDAPAQSFFDIHSLPLHHKLAEVAVPDMSSVDHHNAKNGVEYFKTLAEFLPLVDLSSGKRVYQDGESSEPLDCSIFNNHSTPMTPAQQQKAQRLCGLYHRAYVIIPPDPPTSMATVIFEAFQVGCVPVFLGKAPGLFDHQDVLPSSTSVIRAEHFETMRELGSYLREAILRSDKYRQHLKWKDSMEQASEGFLGQLAQQKGNLVCRICDEYAGRQEERISKLVVRRDSTGDVVPPGVASCAVERLSHAYMYESLPTASTPKGERGSAVDMVYIIHYTPLRDRLRQMVELVDRMGLGVARIITAFDREELTDEDVECFYKEDLKDVPLVPGVISVNIKHMAAHWDMIQNGYKSALILEDDAIERVPTTGTWLDSFKDSMSQVPSGFDSVYVNGCHNEWVCAKGG